MASLRGVPRFDRDGQFLGFTGCNVDISESKLAEIALRHSEERLSTALDIAALGTFDWNLRDNTVTASERTRVIFGFGEGEGGSAEDYFGRMAPDDCERVASEIEATLRGNGRLDTEYRIRLPDGSIRHVASLSQLYRDDQGQPDREVGVFEDVTERKGWEEHQRLLINELNHRVKNTLATVQAIAGQSFRGMSGEAALKLNSFNDRLFALSRAHDVLTRENWEGAELREIIMEVLEPYHRQAGKRFEIDGPRLRLAPGMALALAMALHELATNAAKYGALSVSSGRVTIKWTTAGSSPPLFMLRWEEEGGPTVELPTRRGFGTRLIERMLANDLSGEVRLSYEPAGVTCVVKAPLMNPAADAPELSKATQQAETSRRVSYGS
ncbi:sensor histidine kinase [Microvirga aerilata]|uniref:sensor histidine kinase n=1 Tax=Microvirga aerilata TaxID=670292 RepID=UPI00363B6258